MGVSDLLKLVGMVIVGGGNGTATMILALAAIENRPFDFVQDRQGDLAD